MCLWCPIIKRKEIITVSMFVPSNEQTLILRKWLQEELFLGDHRVIVIYPNEENVFIVPNHEK